jgi:adiponectin receptor
MWHNEVVNIWTHLLPAIFILMLIFYLYFYYGELVRPKAIELFTCKSDFELYFA